MTQITFGKWQGWNTENLARFTEGRSYLAWGAANLKAPQWRKGFQAALDSVPATGIDLDLEAESIMRSDAQIDPDDAYILARDTIAELIEDERRAAAYSAAQQRFFKALAQAGIVEGSARRLYNLLMKGFGIDELAAAEKDGRVVFTSSQKRNTVWQAAIGLDGDLDSITY